MGFAPPSSRSGEAGSVAALRETLRIAEAEHSSERREASRRLSQQAQRFATTDEGLRIERVQIEADVRVRRILNALRVKDESLAEATRRVEELEGLLRLARDDAERSRTRAAELEQVAKDANEHAAHVEAVSRATKLECSRLKGSLADAEFDLDLSTKKYERLLESHAAKNLAHDLVELHLREAARDHAGDELDLEESLEKAADELSYASHGSSVTHVSGQSLEKLPAIPAALPAPAGAPDDGTASSDFT